jgi:hypothetical protein
MKKKLDTYIVTIELPYTHALAVVNTSGGKHFEIPLDLVAQKAYIKVIPQSKACVLFEGYIPQEENI